MDYCFNLAQYLVVLAPMSLELCQEVLVFVLSIFFERLQVYTSGFVLRLRFLDQISFLVQSRKTIISHRWIASSHCRYVNLLQRASTQLSYLVLFSHRR